MTEDQTQAAQPLVSILIPTHNRPDYFELALSSALAQTYPAIEIIVSDNSDDEATHERIAPYLAKHPNIRYSRVPGYTALENFHHCFDLAQGDYVNYLCDDDLFHPAKISTMMAYLLAHPNVGLVTSVRQLIDHNGHLMAAAPPFERVFEIPTLINGLSLGHSLLTKAGSIIGEPTTTLFRRADLKEKPGMFCGKQYTTLFDTAMWLTLLSHKDCVYLPEPLSYFRIHASQDQRQRPTWIRGSIDGIQLFCEAYEHTQFIAHTPAMHEQLTTLLTNFMSNIWAMNEDFKSGAYPTELARIHAVIQQATAILLAR